MIRSFIQCFVFNKLIHLCVFLFPSMMINSEDKRSSIAKPRNWNDGKRNCVIVQLVLDATIGHHCPNNVAFNHVSIKTSTLKYHPSFSESSDICIIYGCSTPWRWCAMSWAVCCYCSTVKVLDSNTSCWVSFMAHYLHQPRSCAGECFFEVLMIAILGVVFCFKQSKEINHLVFGGENNCGAHWWSLGWRNRLSLDQGHCVNKAGDSLMMSVGCRGPIW